MIGWAQIWVLKSAIQLSFRYHSRVPSLLVAHSEWNCFYESAFEPSAKRRATNVFIRLDQINSDSILSRALRLFFFEKLFFFTLFFHSAYIIKPPRKGLKAYLTTTRIIMFLQLWGLFPIFGRVNQFDIFLILTSQ